MSKKRNSRPARNRTATPKKTYDASRNSNTRTMQHELADGQTLGYAFAGAKSPEQLEKLLQAWIAEQRFTPNSAGFALQCLWYVYTDAMDELCFSDPAAALNIDRNTQARLIELYTANEGGGQA